MANPQCSWDAATNPEVPNPDCQPDRHVGYVHATSIEEVQGVLDRGGHVYDPDGDEVVRIKMLDEYRVEYRYERQNEDDSDTTTVNVSQSMTFLIPQPPPTEEELAEVYRSLGVNPNIEARSTTPRFSDDHLNPKNPEEGS